MNRLFFLGLLLSTMPTFAASVSEQEVGKTKGGTIITRRNMMLLKSDLHGADFFWGGFLGFDFSGLHLTGVVFDCASLNNAKFYKNDLRYSSFCGAFLNNTTFKQVDCRGCIFRDISWQGQVGRFEEIAWGGAVVDLAFYRQVKLKGQGVIVYEHIDGLLNFFDKESRLNDGLRRVIIKYMAGGPSVEDLLSFFFKGKGGKK